MAMTTIKGPAIFLAQFAGDAAPFNSLDSICKWAARPRLQGRADADLGRKAVRSEEGRRIQELLRRRERRPPPSTASRSPSSRPICRASWWRCIRPMTRRSTASPPRRCAAIRRRARMGGRSADAGRQGLAEPGPDRACDLLRRARLAVFLSLAAAAGRSGRNGVRRTGEALEADPRRVRQGRRQRLLRDPSGRGPARRRDLRDVPGAGEQPSALQHPLRSVALRAAGARLSAVHRHLSRAHQDVPREGRRVQPERPHRRLWRVPVLDQPGRTLPLARRRPGRFQRASSPSSRSTASRAGRCWSGNAASRIPSKARAKARSSSAITSSR